MVELIFSALRILGAMWMVATFIVVASSFVRLVGEGKDPVEWGGDWKTLKDGPHFQLPHGAYPA